MTNPLDFLRQIVSNSPEYKETAEYLMNRNVLPNSQDSQYLDLPKGTLGQFRRNVNRDTGRGPRNGRIYLDSGYLEKQVEEAIPAYMHELTHASTDELQRQRRENLPRSWRDRPVHQFLGLLPSLFAGNPDTVPQDRFNNAYDKLMPKADTSKTTYRDSFDERPSFAIGNSMTPKAENRIFPLADHRDSTYATEYRILLDLANRSALKNPNKTQR